MSSARFARVRCSGQVSCDVQGTFRCSFPTSGSLCGPLVLTKSHNLTSMSSFMSCCVAFVAATACLPGSLALSVLCFEYSLVVRHVDMRPMHAWKRVFAFFLSRRSVAMTPDDGALATCLRCSFLYRCFTQSEDLSQACPQKNNFSIAGMEV